MRKEKVIIAIMYIQLSILIVGFIVLINLYNPLYKFFTSPLWSSLGVFVTGSGVYIGAKLGLKSAFELEKKKAADEAEVKFKAFMREVYHNEQTFNKAYEFTDFLDYASEEPTNISQDVFNVIKIGISHIKRGAWEGFLKVNTSNEFSPGKYEVNLIVSCVDYEHVLNKAVRDIEMDIAEYEMLANNHVLKERKDNVRTFQTINLKIKENITDVLKAIDKINELLNAVPNQGDWH